MDISARQALRVVDFFWKELRIFLFEVVIFSYICVVSMILSIYFPFSFFNVGRYNVADQGLFQSAACLLFSHFKTLLNNVYQKLHISKV